MRARLRRGRGQVMTEYVILIVIVAIALIWPLTAFRRTMQGFLIKTKVDLCTVVDGAPGGDPPIGF